MEGLQGARGATGWLPKAWALSVGGVSRCSRSQEPPVPGKPGAGGTDRDKRLRPVAARCLLLNADGRTSVLRRDSAGC